MTWGEVYEIDSQFSALVMIVVRVKLSPIVLDYDAGNSEHANHILPQELSDIVRRDYFQDFYLCLLGEVIHDDNYKSHSSLKCG